MKKVATVQLEIKKSSDVGGRLYLTVAMTKIEASVLGGAVDENQALHLVPASITYNLADIFREINPQDGHFLKYLPDGFLSEAQKEAKRIAIEEDIERINSYKHKLPVGEDTSPRALLANAFEGIIANDIEKRKIQEYKDKVLCIVDGNHEFNRASKDADDFPLYDIALALGIEDRYRSEGAFVDIGVGHIGKAGKQARYVFRVQHQAKNNVNFGTADGYEGIDVFVSGHTHKPMDKPLGRLVYNPYNKCVVQKDVENIVSGHFLRFGGYGERGGYRPTSTKLYSVILSGKKDKTIETRGFHL